MQMHLREGGCGVYSLWRLLATVHLEYCKNSNARPVCYVVEIPPSGIGVGESQQTHQKKEGCAALYHERQLQRHSTFEFLRYYSGNYTCIALYIRSWPRKFTRPDFGVPPSHVRFLLPTLLSAPNTTFYYWDYYAVKIKLPRNYKILYS